MSGSYYDTAQICMNGHVTNSMARDYPVRNQAFCSKCGEKTITSCPSCNSAIRGYYHIPGVAGGFGYSAPSFCHDCGEPYPWTAMGLEAAQELADELDELTDAEREQLKLSIPELLKSGPKTVVAETRFKKLMKKAGTDAYEAMRSILVDIASEAVRKSLFGA